MNGGAADDILGGQPGPPTGEASHWTSFAQRWAKLQSPVRPHPDDVRQFEACVADGGGPQRALLLGVTPELAAMQWPEGSSFVAVDRSIEVIRSIWPRDRIRVPAAAIAGRWQHLPLPDGAFDLAVGDGCFTALGTPNAQGEVYRELARVLRPGGRLIMRLFVAPAVREDAAAVFGDLRAGQIGAFDVFKWRLLMATPAASGHAVRVGDTFALWAAAGIDRDGLAQATGWPRAGIDIIDDYRDNDTLLDFAPLDAALDRLAPFFKPVSRSTMGYELAERCPIVVLSRA